MHVATVVVVRVFAMAIYIIIQLFVMVQWMWSKLMLYQVFHFVN